jgi:serine/threonine protein kinase
MGSGAQGWIELATLGGKTYAVKFSVTHPDPAIGNATAFREFEMIKTCQGRFIIQAHAFYPHVTRYSPASQKEENVSAMIMDYAPHGDLFAQVSRTSKDMFGCPRNKQTEGMRKEFLIDKLMTSESYARILFRQVVEAVETCHAHRICHLDIKLENILLDEDWNVKLTDFGYSRECDEHGKIQTITGGTYCFSPPEYIVVDSKGNFKINPNPDFLYDGTKVDVFNMGVVLFILLTGFPPWTDALDKSDRLYTKMRKNFSDFWLEIDANTFMTDSAKDLLTGMLFPRYKKRFTIQQIKESEWFNTEDQIVGIKPVNLLAQFNAETQGRKRGFRKSVSHKSLRKNVSCKRGLRKRCIPKLVRH